jgi:hypothetical protein
MCAPDTVVDRSVEPGLSILTSAAVSVWRQLENPPAVPDGLTDPGR